MSIAWLLLLCAHTLPAAQVVWHVPLWRWLYFVAWCLPLFVMTRTCMFFVFLFLEHRFLTSRRFLYYMIGIKVGSLWLPSAWHVVKLA